ncbi:uncharacterized protein LOC141899892 isoform X2 [Tubulanus polymorphus]|uniref:uncharacterized protein LOC141899892 isoform X2 n=1 Tax=Tubulanus polymorphus TaxID=672921 RepID=UPI003DA55629
MAEVNQQHSSAPNNTETNEQFEADEDDLEDDTPLEKRKKIFSKESPVAGMCYVSKAPTHYAIFAANLSHRAERTHLCDQLLLTSCGVRGHVIKQMAASRKLQIVVVVAGH